jgi:integrase
LRGQRRARSAPARVTLQAERGTELREGAQAAGDELGALRLGEITRADLQVFADRLLDRGLNPSTVHVTLAPLRAIYSHALDRAEVAVNPTAGLKLPTPRGRRERIASREEAERLIAAVREQDRAVWATAMYAGLRLGELRALRWEDADLGAGVIRVKRSWDPKAGEIEPKSRVGHRTVVIPAILGDPELPGHLVEHRIRAADPDGLVFGTGSRPFAPTRVRGGALKAWKAAGLQPITLREARHTYASIMIDAGRTRRRFRPTWGTRRSRSPTTATGSSYRATRTRCARCSTPTSARAEKPRTGASTGAFLVRNIS